MTRSKRYANYAGGRKYDSGGAPKEKSKHHHGKEEKLEVSAIFREYWERCRTDESYADKKACFQAEQKEWDKSRNKKKKFENINS